MPSGRLHLGILLLFCSLFPPRAPRARGLLLDLRDIAPDQVLDRVAFQDTRGKEGPSLPVPKQLPTTPHRTPASW